METKKTKLSWRRKQQLRKGLEERKKREQEEKDKQQTENKANVEVSHREAEPEVPIYNEVSRQRTCETDGNDHSSNEKKLSLFSKAVRKSPDRRITLDDSQDSSRPASHIEKDEFASPGSSISMSQDQNFYEILGLSTAKSRRVSSSPRKNQRFSFGSQNRGLTSKTPSSNISKKSPVVHPSKPKDYSFVTNFFNSDSESDDDNWKPRTANVASITSANKTKAQSASTVRMKPLNSVFDLDSSSSSEEEKSLERRKSLPAKKGKSSPRSSPVIGAGIFGVDSYSSSDEETPNRKIASPTTGKSSCRVSTASGKTFRRGSPTRAAKPSPGGSAAEQKSKQQPRPPNTSLGNDDLWEDSEPETKEAKRRKSKLSKKSGKNRQSKIDRDDRGNNHSDKVRKSRWKKKAPKSWTRQHDAENSDADYVGSDEDVDDFKSTLHPTLATPAFGPFDLTPLVLTQERDAPVVHSVPAALSRYLPDFQREGVQFLYNAMSVARGAILGDDMGLGKTLQVISAITALLGKTGTGRDLIVLRRRAKKVQNFRKELQAFQDRCLLHGGGNFSEKKESMLKEFKKTLRLSPLLPIIFIVPATVVDNWQGEFKLWGHFSVAVYRDMKDKARDLALEDIEHGSAEVLICPRSFFGNKDHFQRINSVTWRLAVVDEFHDFKTSKGNLAANLREMTRKPGNLVPVIGMTGTPMQNRLDELHTLIDLVCPNSLGTAKRFNNKVSMPIKLSRRKDAPADTIAIGVSIRKRFQERIKHLYIRREKTVVLASYLPEKHEQVYLCPLSSLQKKVYEHVLNLPDFLLLRGANTPCDCGVNRSWFAGYKRLRTDAERIEFQRAHSFTRRAQCCYHRPKDEDLDKSPLWKYQHLVDEDVDECFECKNCPTCSLLPALSILYSLSSHLTLLQFDRGDKSGSEVARRKREAFSKMAFPRDVISKLPNGSTDRCDSMMLQREDFFKFSGKLLVLHDLLGKIESEEGRVLLFSFSTRTLDVIQRYLHTENYQFLRLDGSTPPKERQGLVNKFQKDSDIFCFLISTKAGGVGLNLTAANNVIIFDCEWNPANDEQAQDRSFRIGQERDVKVYRLVSQGTIDELKYLRQIYKLHLKQEIFRSGEDSENQAAPRSFLGVEKDKTRKGELFGMENLLSFCKGKSFLGKVWKTEKKRGRSSSGDVIVHKAADLFKKIGSEETIIHETEKELNLRMQQRFLEECGGDESDDIEGFQHADFLVKDKMHENSDLVMGGETQAVDDFACRYDASQTETDKQGADAVASSTHAEGGDLDNVHDVVDDDYVLAHEGSLPCEAKAGPARAENIAESDKMYLLSSANGKENSSFLRKLDGAKERSSSACQKRKAEIVLSDDYDAPVRKKQSPSPTASTIKSNNHAANADNEGCHVMLGKTRVSSMGDDKPAARELIARKKRPSLPGEGNNYMICGIPAKSMKRGQNTTFSVADIFQPKASKP